MEIGIVRPRNITDEMRTAYLDYAMSVIISRALPDARDGLKPVQTRILYGGSVKGSNAADIFALENVVGVKCLAAALGMLCAMATADSQAQVYKWVDASGRVHYGDRPPEAAGAKVEQMKTPALAPAAAGRQPSWQEGPGVGSDTGARGTPDLALLADQEPGYSIYCTATEFCQGLGWIPVGGTSAATPLLGGILALANQQARKAGQPRLGHINPSIYRLAGKKSTREDVYRDITRIGNDLGVLIGPADLGNNQPVGCCTATKNYDLASGWGSVRAPEFSSRLRQLAD